MSSSSSSHPRAPCDHSSQRQPNAAPIACLHRHALESILAFSSLDGLSFALQVSKEWFAVVRRMKSIGACLSTVESIDYCVHSPSLIRHLGSIAHASVRQVHISEELLAQLVQSAINLFSLQCWLCNDLQFEPGSVPHKLRRLDLSIAQITGARINLLLERINSLAALESFELKIVGSFEPDVDFTLCHPPSLSSLIFRGNCRLLTEQQMDQMRSSFIAGLDKFMVDRLPDERLVYLLREPHAHPIRWIQFSDCLRQFPKTHEHSMALASLGGALKTLGAWPAADISFLPHLTQLTELELGTGSSSIVPESFVCPMLTALTLDTPFTSKRMRVLLDRLPLLRRLALWQMSHLQSLAFLAHCPTLKDTLCDLSICSLSQLMPILELGHLLSLRSLTSLQLRNSFQQEMDSSPIQAEFATPSASFPLLRTFVFR